MANLSKSVNPTGEVCSDSKIRNKPKPLVINNYQLPAAKYLVAFYALVNGNEKVFKTNEEVADPTSPTDLTDFKIINEQSVIIWTEDARITHFAYTVYEPGVGQTVFDPKLITIKPGVNLRCVLSRFAQDLDRIDRNRSLFSLVIYNDDFLHQQLFREVLLQNIPLQEVHQVFASYYHLPTLVTAYDCERPFYKDVNGDRVALVNLAQASMFPDAAHILRAFGKPFLRDSEAHGIAISNVVNISNLMIYLIKHESLNWSIPCKIELEYRSEPAAVDIVDEESVVRVRGLPWHCTEKEIAELFIGLNICAGGIIILLTSATRRSGEALIRFIDEDHRNMALQRHRYNMRNRRSDSMRYIEIYRAIGEEFAERARRGRHIRKLQDFFEQYLPQYYVFRLRGLPFDATASDVYDFLTANTNLRVINQHEGIFMVDKGKKCTPSGDAFFYTLDCKSAVKKHREKLKGRYVEVFRASVSEVQQVVRHFQQYPLKNQRSLLPNPINLLMLNREMVLSSYDAYSNTTDALLNELNGEPKPLSQSEEHLMLHQCVRVRGLPNSATTNSLVAFFNEFSHDIPAGGVRPIVNSDKSTVASVCVQFSCEGNARYVAEMFDGTLFHPETYGEEYRLKVTFMLDDIQREKEGVFVELPTKSVATPLMRPNSTCPEDYFRFNGKDAREAQETTREPSLIAPQQVRAAVSPQPAALNYGQTDPRYLAASPSIQYVPDTLYVSSPAFQYAVQSPRDLQYVASPRLNYPYINVAHQLANQVIQTPTTEQAFQIQYSPFVPHYVTSEIKPPAAFQYPGSAPPEMTPIQQQW